MSTRDAPTALAQVRLAAATAALLLLSGCASSYEMKVDALTRPKLDTTASYKIVNRNPTVDSDSLRYKEVEKAVKTALSGRGMYEAPDESTADLIVNLDYGINPPKVTEERRTQPVYLSTPGQIRTETVQVGQDRQGNPIFTTITTQEPPRTEYAGDEEYMVPVVTYEKYLRLSARENKVAAEGKQPMEVWSIDVTSEGSSSNLRKYIPLMAAATIGYIGKDTSGEKNIRLKDDKDGDIAFVKKGL
ncbi:MAG TPA: DUF4136 domain-containing protein [Opitutaceae bacterium]|nr:DUF4136 domain-containing protein [Opitutaceae bacterium]